MSNSRDSDFIDDDYSSMKLNDKSYDYCNFIRVDFTKSVFKNCRFSDCSFVDVDFSKSILHVVFADCNFIRCKFDGSDQSDTEMYGCSTSGSKKRKLEAELLREEPAKKRYTMVNIPDDITEEENIHEYHSGKRTMYPCDQCDTKYSGPAKLKKHIDDFEDAGLNCKDYIHGCPHCGCKLRTISLYIKHASSCKK